MGLKHKNIYIIDGKEKTKEEIAPELMQESRIKRTRTAIEGTGAVPVRTKEAV